MKLPRRLLATLYFLLAAGVIGALADVAVTVGSGTTIFAFTCFTTKVCPAAVTVNSAGTEIAVATSTLQTTGNSSLATIATNTGSAVPAGTNTIGNTIAAPTSSSSLALTHVACGSAVSSCVLKNAAGNLYGVYAECSAACWLMVFNATSAPSNGSTTAGLSSGNMVDCVAIPAGDQRSITYPTFPVAFSVGITAAISSTTCATLTLATTGFVHGTVQ